MRKAESHHSDRSLPTKTPRTLPKDRYTELTHSKAPNFEELDILEVARVSVIAPRRHTVASALAPKGACGLATERSVGDPIIKVSCSGPPKGSKGSCGCLNLKESWCGVEGSDLGVRRLIT